MMKAANRRYKQRRQQFRSCAICRTLTTRRVTCSPKCLRIHDNIKQRPRQQQLRQMRAAARVPKLRNCVMCGTQFVYRGRGGNIITCSLACRKQLNRDRERRYKREAGPRPPLVAQCKVCGKDFVKRNQQTTCRSPECLRRLRRLGYERWRDNKGVEEIRRRVREYRASHKPPPRQIPCTVCGTLFMPGSGVAKLCGSTECRRIHIKKYSRLWKRQESEGHARHYERRMAVTQMLIKMGIIAPTLSPAEDRTIAQAAMRVLFPETKRRTPR